MPRLLIVLAVFAGALVAAASAAAMYDPVVLRVTPKDPTVRDALTVRFRAPFTVHGRNRFWRVALTSECANRSPVEPRPAGAHHNVAGHRRKGSRITVRLRPSQVPASRLPYAYGADPWPAGTRATKWCEGNAWVRLELSRGETDPEIDDPERIVIAGAPGAPFAIERALRFQEVR